MTEGFVLSVTAGLTHTCPDCNLGRAVGGWVCEPSPLDSVGSEPALCGCKGFNKLCGSGMNPLFCPLVSNEDSISRRGAGVIAGTEPRFFLSRLYGAGFGGLWGVKERRLEDWINEGNVEGRIVCDVEFYLKKFRNHGSTYF